MPRNALFLVLAIFAPAIVTAEDVCPTVENTTAVLSNYSQYNVPWSPLLSLNLGSVVLPLNSNNPCCVMLTLTVAHDDSESLYSFQGLDFCGNSLNVSVSGPVSTTVNVSQISTLTKIRRLPSVVGAGPLNLGLIPLPLTACSCSLAD